MLVASLVVATNYSNQYKQGQSLSSSQAEGAVLLQRGAGQQTLEAAGHIALGVRKAQRKPAAQFALSSYTVQTVAHR